ncbi:uncharacterized protein SAPINGB_P003057 [Magnusiomyces paraingens]|uniref:Anaphase-promoting complex subunit 5 n=1 Tax=Magnusiomyces paraingens TaxID=2606893 RepID=A0A5E8BKA4_9ASCO|nr:uncharacterized protein SAPINGB_P003045 [Saprochaete ingens]XP_031853666.1 uncharacterized protein SAPINGB_P003057 [Saprochaete ingens]VVT51283.1 unnamed protein product [Saprochaete ingens]VVT51319.1 unnamed protein product [Saprochaete ingens]
MELSSAFTKNNETFNANDNCNRVFDQLLEVLFSIRSIDELHTFINRLPGFVIIADGKHDDKDSKIITESASLGINCVTQNSVIGTFFTKCFLEFDSMAFDQIINLWDCLVSFREPFLQKYQYTHSKDFCSASKESAKLLKIFFGSEMLKSYTFQDTKVLQSLLPDLQHIFCISSETLDIMLEGKVAVLDRSDGVSLSSINKILGDLSKNDKSLPVSAYYIKYFKFIQENDYEQAFEYLHRFYDYTMHRHGRAHYHNALFTLATLHAEFESFEEALRAVSEAISVARENKDNMALTDIHFWLYNFISLHPQYKIPDFLSSKDQMIQFLKAKSQDTSYSLYSLVLQHESLHQLINCGSLIQVFESLFKSFFISVTSNSVLPAFNYFTLEASIWEKLGIFSIASTYNQISFTLSKMTYTALPYYGIVILARISKDENEFLDSISLIDSVMPKILETENADLIGLSYMPLTFMKKCKIGLHF